MIDLLIGIIYAGILFCWEPSLWAVSLLQVGALALGALMLGRQITSAEPLRFTFDSLTLALLAIWGPLQIASRQTVGSAETASATWMWISVAALFLVAKRLLRDRADLDRFLDFNLWLGTAIAVVSVILNFSSPRRIFWYFPSQFEAFGPFIYKNQFAAFLELLIPVAFYKMLTDARRRMPYSIAFAALFACMVASVSRAGLALAIAEVAVLVYLGWRRKLISTRTLGLVAVQVIVLPVAFSLIIGWDATWSHFQEQSPYAVRAKLVQSTYAMIRERPLVGWGLGTWRMVYPQYATFDIARWANEAHNDWLQWAADGGIGFPLVLLAMAGVSARRAWRQFWGLGVPAMFLHCLVDYPTREPAIAAALFTFAGALAAGEAVPSRARASGAVTKITKDERKPILSRARKQAVGDASIFGRHCSTMNNVSLSIFRAATARKRLL